MSVAQHLILQSVNLTGIGQICSHRKEVFSSLFSCGVGCFFCLSLFFSRMCLAFLSLSQIPTFIFFNNFLFVNCMRKGHRTKVGKKSNFKLQLIYEIILNSLGL